MRGQLDSSPSRRLRVGVYALPFGYGPGSKAAAIVRAVERAAPRCVEWTFMSDGVGYELLLRTGVAHTFMRMPTLEVAERIAAEIESTLDAVVVLMHRAWANRLAPTVAVFCVDSLGFMWGSNAFDDYPGINSARRYYVQDVFDSVDRMSRTSLRHFYPVPPIVDIDAAAEAPSRYTVVFNLGGVRNPFNEKSVRTYVDPIVGFASRTAPRNGIVLTSESARQSALTEYQYPIASVSHAAAITAFKSANIVYTAPGLTALLELAALRSRVIPLPPANFSQLLNIRRTMQIGGAGLGATWRFLSDSYADIAEHQPESEGVAQVERRNRTLLKDSAFWADYERLGQSDAAPAQVLPALLVSASSGADVIADDMLADLLLARRGCR